MTPAAEAPLVEKAWAWLADVPDPEIPVISVVDLGIVRDVAMDGEEMVVTITPTYSGCPATHVISADIEKALRDHGVQNLRLETRIAPPWTTDWISENGRERLRGYGIAPPQRDGTPAGEARIDVGAIRRKPESIQCPNCGSVNTQRVSEFGSTPCKAHYRCNDCLEPFDYFKRF